MKKNHKSTQTIQNECPDKIPASIKFGRVLLVASSIFLVFVAALELYEFITTLLEGIDASDPFDFISVWSEPLVVLFLLFCTFVVLPNIFFILLNLACEFIKLHI